ncbi:hypothetical protein V491_01263 [Pseudogymnoascus sp. VKM F-3775]|nr:hypothetical protein V491_01263 [Pseudogymnoascus sp. VKM F-3775]
MPLNPPYSTNGSVIRGTARIPRGWAYLAALHLQYLSYQTFASCVYSPVLDSAYVLYSTTYILTSLAAGCPATIRPAPGTSRGLRRVCAPLNLNPRTRWGKANEDSPVGTGCDEPSPRHTTGWCTKKERKGEVEREERGSRRSLGGYLLTSLQLRRVCIPHTLPQAIVTTPALPVRRFPSGAGDSALGVSKTILTPAPTPEPAPTPTPSYY